MGKTKQKRQLISYVNNMHDLKYIFDDKVKIPHFISPEEIEEKITEEKKKKYKKLIRG